MLKIRKHTVSESQLQCWIEVVRRQCSSRVASVHFTLPDGHVRVAQRGVSLSVARWRMPPEELLGVVGLSSSLGKWRCQEQKNNEKENERGGRRSDLHHFIRGMFADPVIAEYSAYAFLWNVEQPARVR